MRALIGFLLLGVVACGGGNDGSQGDGSGGSGGTGDLNLGGSGGSGGGCTKVETISALAIERPEPFDVIIVADHSGSIGWSRESLTAGLQNLLAYVHGQQVRFFVLTPTQYGASSSVAQNVGNWDLVEWKDPVTDEPYQNAITEFVQTCKDVNGTTVDCALRDQYYGRGLSLEGVWNLNMPPPIAAITPDMSAAQIAAEQDKISDAILALGVEGAQREQPICSLNRYILQPPGNLPEHAVFVVISDEDDHSTPDECLAGFSHVETAAGPRDEECTSNCDYYRYNTQHFHPIPSLHHKCVAVDDAGVEHPESYFEVFSTYSEGTCTEGQTTPCDAAAIEYGSVACGAGYVVRECTTSCEGAGYIYSCSLERPDTSQNLCTSSFQEGGVTYSNLENYCNVTRPDDTPWTDCTMQGYTSGTGTFYDIEETIHLVVDVPTLPEMATAFRAKADSVFGANGYFVESIILDPAFSCEVGAGQSYGTLLGSLASSSADKFPLCGDYAPALQRIQSFARRLVKNEFVLDLAKDETLIGVVARDVNGNTRTLAESDYTFDPETQVLTVKPDLLGPSDTVLDLTISDSCIEIVE